MRSNFIRRARKTSFFSFTLTSSTDFGADGVEGGDDDVTTPAGQFMIGVNLGFGF